jgi:hypothetical protein
MNDQLLIVAILLIGLVLLDLAALRWGYDSLTPTLLAEPHWPDV